MAHRTREQCIRDARGVKVAKIVNTLLDTADPLRPDQLDRLGEDGWKAIEAHYGRPCSAETRRQVEFIYRARYYPVVAERLLTAAFAEEAGR